jgi:hypothetical protein
LSPVGTFETCSLALTTSVYRGRQEVTADCQKRRF